MTIDGEENCLLTVIPEKNLVQKVNLTSKQVLGGIDVGEGAYAVVLMGER